MSKIILGFAGEIASGKGTATKYIVEKYNGSSYRFSTMLRDVLDRLYLGHSREAIQKLSTFLRQTFGENLMAKVMFEDVKKDVREVIAIDGVRRLADIEYLSQLPEFKLVYVEADMEKRFERITRRGENMDDGAKTFEEFKKDHTQESESQIRGLKDHAAFMINNNGLFEDLYQQVDEIISKLK